MSAPTHSLLALDALNQMVEPILFYLRERAVPKLYL